VSNYGFVISICSELRYCQARGLLLQHSFHSEPQNNLLKIAVYLVIFERGTAPYVITFAPVSLVSVLPMQFLNTLQAKDGVLEYCVLLQSQY
jgi:hypothetical protein